MIQAAVKLSRLTLSPNHEDSWVDLTGYAACGYECATLEADPLSSAPVATGIGDGEEERGDQGHRSGSVQARYSHVTAEMRRRLLADLTRVWTEAVEARRRLSPGSSVGMLDRLLRPS
jgi:hypothetical protein